MPSPKLRCSTAAVYAAAPDANYPPVFLYALWAIDRPLGEVPEWLVKALTIPFDLAVGGALYVLLRRIADRAAALVLAFWYPMLSVVPMPRDRQAAYLWLPTWRDECRLEEPIVCGSRVTETDEIPTAVPTESEGRLRSSP